MKKHYKVSLVLACIVTLLITAFLIVRNQESQKPYKFLTSAAQQQFGDKIGESRQGMTDCYPMGTGKTSCPSLIYTVSEKECLNALSTFKDAAADKESCSDNRLDFKYQGHQVKTYIGEGNNNDYWVKVFLEEDL